MTELKVFRSFALLLALALISMGFRGGARLPDSDEYVRFEIKNAGIIVEASFNEYDIQIDYNPAAPATSKFKAVIAVSSVNTGIDMRNEHLQEEEYFHASEYPNITFESTSVSVASDGQLTVNGTLTIRGVSKSVVLKTTPEKIGDTTYFETSLTLNRLDYKVGESSWIMGNEVTCIIRAAAD